MTVHRPLRRPDSLRYNMDMSSTKQMRLEATVSGRVQGVSFRYYTQQRARQLGLAGWVANQPDGTVRVVAEGDVSALDDLVDFLERGSPAARVDRVEAQRLPATGTFDQFRIQQL